MQPLFVPRDAPPKQREAVRLVSSALVQGLGGDAAGGARLTLVALPLAQLLDLYRRPREHRGGGDADAAERPTLDALRHPKMLQLLMEGEHEKKGSRGCAGRKALRCGAK